MSYVKPISRSVDKICTFAVDNILDIRTNPRGFRPRDLMLHWKSPGHWPGHLDIVPFSYLLSLVRTRFSIEVWPNSRLQARRISTALGVYRPRHNTLERLCSAARHFVLLLFSDPQLPFYAAFGSWGLVVPATEPRVAPLAVSAGGSCPCCLCFRTAFVTPLPVLGACVGKRTALSAFSVCSPEGRYLGSRSPI